MKRANPTAAAWIAVAVSLIHVGCASETESDRPPERVQASGVEGNAYGKLVALCDPRGGQEPSFCAQQRSTYGVEDCLGPCWPGATVRYLSVETDHEFTRAWVDYLYAVREWEKNNNNFWEDDSQFEPLIDLQYTFDTAVEQDIKRDLYFSLEQIRTGGDGKLRVLFPTKAPCRSCFEYLFDVILHDAKVWMQDRYTSYVCAQDGGDQCDSWQELPLQVDQVQFSAQDSFFPPQSAL